MLYKVEYSREDMEKAAAVFVEAIKTISTKPANLDNLGSYLSHHFPVMGNRTQHKIIWRYYKC